MVEKTDIILFLILNIFTLIIFAPWLSGHYATDTYNIMNVGYEYYSIHNSLIDGRIFMFGIMQLAAILNIKCEIMVSVLLALALVTSNIAAWIIKNIIMEKIQNKKVGIYIISYIIAYSLIYNFMYIENLYFLECFVMAIAILLNLIAAKIYFEERKHYLIKTAPILLISMFCYQGTISVFIVFVAMFLLINKCNIKKCLKKLLIATIMVASVCIINLIFVEIIVNVLGIEQSRLNNNLLNNVKYILSTKIVALIGTSNNFYPAFFVSFAIMLITMYIIYFTPDKKEMLRGAFLILTILFCVDLPYVVTLTAFWAGRTRFGIGALVGILIIYIIAELKTKKENDKEKIQIKRMIYGIAIIYFTINLVNYLDIIANSKITNKCEKEYVQEINEYITEYEKNNNTKIEKIQLVYDNNVKNAFYDVCTRNNVMTWNAVSCRWSAIGVINVYTKRNLKPAFSEYISMDMDNMYKVIENVLYVKIAVI